MVGTAAALLEPIARTDRGLGGEIHEGPSYEIVVGPGLVQTRTRDYARLERTHERQNEARRKRVDDLVGEELRREVEGLEPLDRTPKRGRITGWSAKSRSNMRQKIAKLDFAPLFEHAPLAAMITLTYPGACGNCREAGRAGECRAWLDVAPDRDAVRRHVNVLKTRYQRAWKHKIRGLWKLEFQGRGAPHLHILIAPPRGVSFPRGDNFRSWLSRTWADIVDHPDDEIAAAHLLAGTGVDYAEGLRAKDPRRVATYFSKHGVLSGKEYQHEVPPEWQEAGGSGRWWGVWGLEEATATVAVRPEAWVWVQRIARRHSRSQSYVRTERRPRTRGGAVHPKPEPVQVDGRTELRPVVHGLAGAELVAARRTRYRKVNVRTYVGKGRSGSGYRVLNDGPGWLAQVALWLPTVVGPAPEPEPPRLSPEMRRTLRRISNREVRQKQHDDAFWRAQHERRAALEPAVGATGSDPSRR